MYKFYTFPKNFVWGTATSSHQTEGGNKNNDWWTWETRNHGKDEYPLETSGDACDSYNRYEEDFMLCKKMNNNAVRISLEWSRLESEKNKYDQNEFEHYRKVLQSAKNLGLKTYVTLHHFTNPRWFADLGGWANINSSNYFSEYASKCAEKLGDLVDVFLTINEPQVLMLQGYIRGIWPPNKSNPFLAMLAQINMILAHRKAYDSIKNSIDKPVGIVKNVVWQETLTNNILDKLFVKIAYFIGSDSFLRPIKSKLDLIGLNYYFTNRISNLKNSTPLKPCSDVGWWIHSEGLKNVLMELSKYKIPIYVTENGLADAKDNLRAEFVKNMITACAQAVEEGCLLKGYFHWSLLDNYEWHLGFWPRFGLVEIDRENNLERIPRKSFFVYGDICKNNSLIC